MSFTSFSELHKEQFQKILSFFDVTTSARLSTAAQSLLKSCYVENKLVTGTIASGGGGFAALLPRVHLPSLIGLCAQGEDTDLGVPTLALLTKEFDLQHLTIKLGSLAVAPCIGLCSAMKVGKKIRILNISDCDFQPEAINALSDLLKIDSTMTCFSAVRCTLRGSCSVIFKALTENASIQTLDMSSNAIPPACAKDIKQMLQTTVTLRSLNVANNRLRSNGSEEVFEGLADNKSLTSLSLAKNELRYNTDGEADERTMADSLAKALEINRIITHLDVHDNETPNLSLDSLCAVLARRGNLNLCI